MNRALYAAASGMAAQQENLEVIADNLANSEVAGFKGAVESFAEIVDGNGGSLGTTALGRHPIFTQGKLVRSGGPFDVAIEGAGFFSVSDGHGRVAYTRDGQFARSADGTLANAEGWRLRAIHIPRDALSIDVSEDGTVTAKTPASKRVCGQIRLTTFLAPERLQCSGSLFFATAAAGSPQAVRAGTPDGPAIKFGVVEQSNVTIVEAMMQILAAQRAYEANAKGVQAADEMMRIADNLSRD